MSNFTKATNKDGGYLGYPISASRLRMALRLLPPIDGTSEEKEEELRRLTGICTRDELAKRVGVEPHDVEGAEHYYGINRKAVRATGRGESVEDLWPLLEPRIKALLNEALTAALS